MSKMIDLTGKRFGKLTVIKRDGTYEKPCGVKQPTWLCACYCGNTVVVIGTNLRSGRTVSCGCMQREISKEAHTKHGLHGTRLYKVWKGMLGRCYNPKHKAFKNYGGRGITVCDEWRRDFKAFHDWAMANGYDEKALRGKCTIDRINVNDGYRAGNCRWVDMIVQVNNRRCSKRRADG